MGLMTWPPHMIEDPARPPENGEAAIERPSELARIMKRLPFLFVTALLVGLSIHDSVVGLTHIDGSDLDVYRRASLHLLHEGNPYIYLGEPGFGGFRYGAWFAVAFIPWALMPRDIAMLTWVPAMLAFSILPVADVIRTYGLLGLGLAALMEVLLIGSVAAGNVQPLLIAALYFGLHTRWGPAIVGLAASLKIVPILFVLPWVARGEWRKVVVSVAIGTILLAPSLFFELPPSIADSRMTSLIDLSPLLWTTTIAAATLLAVRLGRTKWATLAAACAVLAALPRLLNLDLSYLLPAVRPTPTSTCATRPI